MSGLPNVPQLQQARLSREDLTEILRGLAPGEYLSRDLLPRVNVWLESQGRKPVSTKTVGESLTRALKLESRRVAGGVKAFRITPEAVAGRDWFRTTT